MLRRRQVVDLHAGGSQDFDKSVVFLDCAGERWPRAEAQRLPFRGNRFIAPERFPRMLEQYARESSEFGECAGLRWHSSYFQRVRIDSRSNSRIAIDIRTALPAHITTAIAAILPAVSTTPPMNCAICSAAIGRMIITAPSC